MPRNKPLRCLERSVRGARQVVIRTGLNAVGNGPVRRRVTKSLLKLCQCVIPCVSLRAWFPSRRCKTRQGGYFEANSNLRQFTGSSLRWLAPEKLDQSKTREFWGPESWHFASWRCYRSSFEWRSIDRREYGVLIINPLRPHLISISDYSLSWCPYGTTFDLPLKSVDQFWS